MGLRVEGYTFRAGGFSMHPCHWVKMYMSPTGFETWDAGVAFDSGAAVGELMVMVWAPLHSYS